MQIRPDELIAEYCNMKQLKKALNRHDPDAVRGEIGSAVQAFLEEQPDDETLSLLVNCLFVVLQYDIFYGYLEHHGLSLRETYADRAAMRSDWDAWKQSQPLSDAEWLSDRKESSKIRIFEVIEALGLHAEDFDEIPAPDMTEPKWQKKTYGEFEIVTIADAKITDDGGLFTEPNPAGKSFVLHDADGVTYYLNNVRKSKIPGTVDMEDGRLYTANGWIDGYTGRQSRDIEFEIYDGGVIFTYTTDGVDDSAAESDPRWAAYTEWTKNRIEGRRRRQAAFLAEYGGSAALH